MSFAAVVLATRCGFPATAPLAEKVDCKDDQDDCDHGGQDNYHDDQDVQDDHHDDHDGASPKSHKHFIPYMGFCASIWDNVRHHCHHHHYCHHIQKSKSINTVACLIAH